MEKCQRKSEGLIQHASFMSFVCMGSFFYPDIFSSTVSEHFRGVVNMHVACFYPILVENQEYCLVTS